MTAYDEFVTPILTGANREKYEWAIGSALAGGPEKALIICGYAGTGKSELMTITKRIFNRDDMPPVTIQDGLRYMSRTSGYVYMGSNQSITVDSLRNIVTATSGYQHADEVYYPLYEAMTAETDLIANACLERYMSMGPTAYEDLTINNLPA